MCSLTPSLSHTISGCGFPLASHSKRTVFAVGYTCDFGFCTITGGVNMCSVTTCQQINNLIITK